MQQGTEITEAKAKINSRSSAESNNNVPEQGATESRRGELETGSRPSCSLQQITQTECRLDRSLCFMAVGCCTGDGPGNGSGVMGPSGINSQATQTADCSERRNQSPHVILLSKVPWHWGRPVLPGSQLNQPSGQAEKQLDAPASRGPVGPGWQQRSWGPWGSLCLGAGEPKAFGSLDTLLAFRAWLKGYWGIGILTPCWVAGCSRDLLSFCGQTTSIKHYLFAQSGIFWQKSFHGVWSGQP